MPVNKKTWIRIEVSCPAELADELALEVAETFNVGVETTDEEGIRFYLGEHYLVRDWQADLQRAVDEVKGWHGSHVPISFTWSTIPEEDWADRWKVHFKPFRVGRNFIICPTWEETVPGPQDKLIRMDPGRAFGTGHHETTKLCLEWLERWASGRADLGLCSLLDVGTGSGILAIAAALLGFGRVTAVDIDPEAIEVAEENVRLSGLSDRIHFVNGSAADISDSFDVVLANIQSLPLIAMAETLAARLGGSGRMALSGILVDQEDDVRAAYEGLGLRFLNHRVAGEWVLLEFELPGRGGSK